MFTLKYTLARIREEKDLTETIKTCDKGMEGLRNCLLIIAKDVGGFIGWITIWIMTRFVKRVITNESIEYQFYLIGEDKKVEQK
jgi:hypothetical protein